MTARQQWSIVAMIVLVLGGGLFVASRVFGDQLYPVSVGSRAPQFRAATVDSVPTHEDARRLQGTGRAPQHLGHLLPALSR